MSTPQETPEPAELIAKAQAEFDDISAELLLTDAFEEIQAMDGNVSTLPQEVQRLRSRGYIYHPQWAATVETIQAQWPNAKKSAEALHQRLVGEMEKEAIKVKSLLRRAERATNLADDTGPAVEVLEKQIRSAENQIESVLSATATLHSSVVSEMEEAEFLLDELDEADFDLLHGEHGIKAVKAEWTDKREESVGTLFLTNQRILFELEQKVAKKKFLFITTEHETVQRLLWQAPLGSIEDVSAEDKGGMIGFGVKEMLEITFGREAKEAPRKVALRFRDHADNEGFMSLINRAKSSSLATILDSEEGESSGPVVVPTVCPSCKASLPPVVKGATSVTCEYCGTRVAVPV